MFLFTKGENLIFLNLNILLYAYTYFPILLKFVKETTEYFISINVFKITAVFMKNINN